MHLVLPYTRLELPGWGYLLRVFNVIGDQGLRWDGAPTKDVKLKESGYVVSLNLENWSERLTYFLGRYYDLELQLLMNKCLRPGDRFIDIGANVGMISLHAAWLVASRGLVESFEPNPSCCQRIVESLSKNKITQVKLFEMGLSDNVGSLTLKVITKHSGMGTFAQPDEKQQELISDTFEVQVQTGDSVILKNSTPVKLIKIDVEGFEYRVLKGISQTLSRWYPIVVLEVAENWLKRAGTSRIEVCDYMRQFGYVAYGPSTRRRYLRHELTLTLIQDKDIDNVDFNDFVWVHPKSLGAGDLASLFSKVP